MRRLVTLGAVLVALLAVWGIQRLQHGRVVASAPAQTLALAADRVTKLRVAKHGETPVEIERVAGAWRITKPGDYRASDTVVSGALQAIDSLALVDVVSNNPANRSKFQVDSMGTRVQVEEGGKNVLDLIVGKSSPDFSHTYVRREGADDVYRADGILTYQFNKRLDDWRDKAILELDQADIVRLLLDYPKEKTQVALAKRDTVWTVAAAGSAPEAADSLAMAQVLRGASKLSTVSFVGPEEAAKVDFTKPDFRLQVDTDSGSHTIVFVEAEGGKMYAQKSGEPQIYQMYKTSLAHLMKKADDLRHKKV